MNEYKICYISKSTNNMQSSHIVHKQICQTMYAAQESPLFFKK